MKKPPIHTETVLISVAVLSWAVHLWLIWGFRFVPAVDYPEWLLQANILAFFQNPAYGYSAWYALVYSPVPNGGFIIPAALLARIIPIEIAGKLVLSLYIIGFPLAVRSYFRATGNSDWLWFLSILLLFNISFVNGNIAFLIGTCILLFLLSQNEALNHRRSPVFSVLLAALLFFAHGLCALVYLFYLALRLVTLTQAHEKRMVLIAQASVLIGLSVIYLITKPHGGVGEIFSWGFGLRYRLSALSKSFIACWPFPPYEFSIFQTTVNALLFLSVLTVAVFSIPRAFSHWNQSSLASLAIFTLAVALVAPRQGLSFGEPTQRLAFIGLILLARFIGRPATTKLLHFAISILIALVTLLRVHDFRQASTTLERRNAFISTNIPAGYPVLTMDDGRGWGEPRFLQLVPRGTSLIFQSDYLLLSGGYNPLSFRTGFLATRHNFLSTVDSLSRARGNEGLGALRGSDIPQTVDWIVLDTGVDRLGYTALRLAPEFNIESQAEIHPGIMTAAFRRVKRI